jgi:diacylglycerol kinase family enzyme
MKRTACLIFNPASGQGNLDRDLEWIRQQLEPILDLTVYSTTLEDQANTLQQEAIAQAGDLGIVSGGDGTVPSLPRVMILPQKVRSMG